jgi:hypothetical protein
MAVQVFCPAAAAVGEVLSMGDQPLVQLTGEEGFYRPRLTLDRVPSMQGGESGVHRPALLRW